MTQRNIELLAPARTTAIAHEAILHGADAVYIGGPAFGARAAASNSLTDIADLVAFAHPFGVRIYVALNTILYEDELSEAERIIWQLYEIGVDALIIQDYGILALHLPPIALHASTQMDTRTADKVDFLRQAGFTQVVLARELTLPQIAAIHTAVPQVPLEVFVHGAVCVSYSGQCYASQHSFGRSANRGDCAQFCRLPFDLIDVASGDVLVAQKHLLSLRDMNRSMHIPTLLDAGVSSFKIEGRLKDATYVKNITAHYRRMIDAAIADRPDLRRASYGKVHHTFTPNPAKTFNRGFSSYYLSGRAHGTEAFDTPKAMGEYVGEVKKITGKVLAIKAFATLSNGDGLCYMNAAGVLAGFRCNRIEANKIHLTQLPTDIHIGAKLYRNTDRIFEIEMSRPTATRVMGVQLLLTDTPTGISLRMTHEDGTQVTVHAVLPLSLAQTPQQDNIIRQLSKLGDTTFIAQCVDIAMSQPWFIPASVLAQLRRDAVTLLTETRHSHYQRPPRGIAVSQIRYPEQRLTYRGNVANSKAKQYLQACGVKEIAPAMETQATALPHPLLMLCKHCIRYSYGACPVYQESQPSWQRPLALRLGDGRIFPLVFDCKKCEMSVYAAD